MSPNTPASITTITLNPTLDISTAVEQVCPEVKLRTQAPRYEPGGGGINVARAIHQLGGQAHACFLAGSCMGDLLQQLLREQGIDYTRTAISGMTRQSLTVLETSTGLQYRFNQPGPTIQTLEWERFLAQLVTLSPPPTYWVASGSFPPGVPPDFLAHLLKPKPVSHTRLVVDTSGEALVRSLTAGCYLIKPNLKELEALAKEPLPDEASQIAFCQSLLQRYPLECVVVSLGETGAQYITRTSHGFTPAPSVPVNSKVGAGDSMLAGLVLALAKGWPLPNAVRYGVAAGSAAVMSPGTGLCRREDTEALYQQISLIHCP